MQIGQLGRKRYAELQLIILITKLFSIVYGQFYLWSMLLFCLFAPNSSYTRNWIWWSGEVMLLRKYKTTMNLIYHHFWFIQVSRSTMSAEECQLSDDNSFISGRDNPRNIVHDLESPNASFQANYDWDLLGNQPHSSQRSIPHVKIRGGTEGPSNQYRGVSQKIFSPFQGTQGLFSQSAASEKQRKPYPIDHGMLGAGVLGAKAPMKTTACPMCPYVSYNRSDVTKHMRTHTRDKPFQCFLCSYKCSQKCNLTAHIARKHPVQ